MSDETTFSKEQLDAAIADALAANNATRDEAEKGLKAKVDELLSESKAAKDKAKEEAEARQKAADEAAKKSGDTEALEASWQAKFDAMVAAKDEENAGLRGTVEKVTVGQQATSIAAELAVQGSAGVLERLILPRLGYEMKDGDARVVVKDATGKPSALTVDELKAEIAADTAFAPLIAASKASGGGAANANGGAGNQKTVTRSAFDGMTHPARAEFSKSGGKVVDD